MKHPDLIERLIGHAWGAGDWPRPAIGFLRISGSEMHAALAFAPGEDYGLHELVPEAIKLASDHKTDAVVVSAEPVGPRWQEAIRMTQGAGTIIVPAIERISPRADIAGRALELLAESGASFVSIRDRIDTRESSEALAMIGRALRSDIAPVVLRKAADVVTRAQLREIRQSLPERTKGDDARNIVDRCVSLMGTSIKETCRALGFRQSLYYETRRREKRKAAGIPQSMMRDLDRVLDHARSTGLGLRAAIRDLGLSIARVEGTYQRALWLNLITTSWRHHDRNNE